MEMAFEWTPALEAKVIELWNSGKSSGEIQTELKIPTRNMVIGKVKRSPDAIQKRSEPKSNGKNISSALVQKIENLWRLEYSLAMIVKDTGVPKSTIQSIVSQDPKRFPPKVGKPKVMVKKKATRLKPVTAKRASELDALFAPKQLPKSAIPDTSVYNPHKAPEGFGETHFDQARVNQCKYPLWSQGEYTGNVCGHPRIGALSWCAEHFRLIYKPESAIVQKHIKRLAA